MQKLKATLINVAQDVARVINLSGGHIFSDPKLIDRIAQDFCSG